METVSERCCSSNIISQHEKRIQFKSFELKDHDLLTSYIQQQESRLCDYSTGTLMMWRDYYQLSFVIVDKTMIIKANSDGIETFLIPIGANIEHGFKWIEEYCRYHSIKMRFNFVSQREVDLIHQYYPSKEVQHLEGWHDYIYDYQQLLNLRGKKFQTQRNHINRFNKDYPNHRIETLGKSNINQTIDFFKSKIQRESDDLFFVEEQKKTLETLKSLDCYKMEGIVLFVENEIVGFTLGEANNGTLFVHIEKTNHDFVGANQKLFHSYLEGYKDKNIIWVNREEDMGDEGLRKSKMSWRPVELLEKYEVIVNS